MPNQTVEPKVLETIGSLILRVATDREAYWFCGRNTRRERCQLAPAVAVVDTKQPEHPDVLFCVIHARQAGWKI